MGMTSNIKYTCRGLPLLDSGCHHSSCFTCISTTLQSRSEVQTTWFFNRNVEVLVTVMQVKNLKVIPILEWPNVRFPERTFNNLFLYAEFYLFYAIRGRIMPNCWLSSRVSIAVASLCFYNSKDPSWTQICRATVGKFLEKVYHHHQRSVHQLK